MKTLILTLALISGVFGATVNVCTSGCGPFTTAQYALDNSNDGDTIVLQSGQNLGSLIIPGNRHHLTFKSSLIDTYPRNYRITRNNPSLARLTTVSIGDPLRWAVITPNSSTLTNTPGQSPTPHGFSIGDQVIIGGAQYSAYACASVNQPPYTSGACDASRVGFINIRTDTGLSNGMSIYFMGRTLPPPLAAGTVYYVVNFVYGGSVSNADKFQIAATPGGGPITIPQFNPAGQDFVICVPPLPQRIGDLMYVVDTPTPSTFQLSPTPGGPAVTFTQTPKGYDGSRLNVGFSVTRNAPVHDITFDGIEVSPVSDNGIYYPFYVSSAIGSAAGEHYGINVLRCWIHGADDQQDFPMATVNIAGHDIEIGWSVIENAYSTGNDTQGIGFMSTANVSIHDNEIKGGTEGIMSGGNFPWFAFKQNTTGVTVYRNYIWKPLKAYIGIAASYVGPTQFQFLSRYGGADCAAVANNPNLGTRCFAYEGHESDPANAVISRTEWTTSATNSMFTATGAAGQVGFIYLLKGLFHMDYNFSGAVSCPAGVVCTFVASPFFSPASTRIGIAAIGSSGTFDGSFYQQNRNVWSKNLIESKYGDNWLIEGNVLHRQSNCDNGSTCQDPAIQFTVGVNGSGGGEPINYMASTSHSVIRNNLFRHLSSGITGVGQSFAIDNGGVGLAYEFAGFGQSIDNQVTNNLFWDLGSTEYTAYLNGDVVRQQNTANWTVDHNTAVDARIGFLADQIKGATYSSNVLIPYRSACVGSGAECSHPAASSNIGVQNDSGGNPFPFFGGTGTGSWYTALTAGNIDATSQFLNNIVMNRPGFYFYVTRGPDYPFGTYLVQYNDVMPGGANPDPSVLFVNWQERDNSVPPNGLNYRAGNYRLAPGMSAAYPANDESVIGADIDQIEALTGRSGVDVEQGLPTFAVRTQRQITTGAATVISYLTNGSPCTIQVWPNSSYSGTPTVNITDIGAAVDGSVISVTLPDIQSGNNYFGKRWCGSEVDVFSIIMSVMTPSVRQPPAVYIDSLASGATVSGTVTVSGWALDNTTARGTAIGSVLVKVDGVAVGSATYGTPRSDVCGAYPGRPNCPNVGFTYRLNVVSFSAGSHTITAVATDTDIIPSSASYSLTVTVSGLPPPVVYIDSLTSGATVSGAVTVSGWAIDNPTGSGTAIGSVQVRVDGKAVGIATYGTPRPDVCGIYPGRPGCPNVGFTYQLNTTSLSAGSHTVTAVATDTDVMPDSGSYSITVTVTGAPPPKVFIDSWAPGATVSGMVTISGWAIDTATAMSAVQVQVDGIAVGTATYGTPRPDVCRIYPGRPGCPNVGFTYQLNTTSLSAGLHTITAVATDTDVSPDSGSYSLSVTVIALPPPRVYIDSLAQGATVSSAVTVSGWAIHTASAISAVQVQVDGTAIGSATYGTPRPDVCGVYPGSPGCPNVGFTYQLNPTSLSAGKHTITAAATTPGASPQSASYSVAVTK